MKCLYNRLARGLLVGIALAVSLSSAALASVQINTTRVVYPARADEVTVKMNHRGSGPVLMQVWVDRGDPDMQPQHADAPFLVTPPIFRLDPGKGQSVRVAFTGESLPQDRESLFWFNALEVPPLPENAERNYMQIATRQRMKLFYRPAGLRGSLAQAVTQVKWRVLSIGGKMVLRGENPSGYHVSYSALAVQQGGRRYETPGGMIAPHGQHDFPLSGFDGRAADATVLYRWLSDYGSGPEQQSPLL